MGHQDQKRRRFQNELLPKLTRLPKLPDTADLLESLLKAYQTD